MKKNVFIADGGWDAHKGAGEEERRVYYVAMTRAKQTLTLFRRADDSNPYCKVLLDRLSGEQIVVMSPVINKPLPDTILKRRYETIGLKDIYLDYAGRLPASNPAHQHLKSLEVDSHVRLKAKGDRLEICNPAGHPIAKLSSGASERWNKALPLVEGLRVVSMVERRADDSKDPDFRKLLKVDRWEVPILEAVWLESLPE